MQEVYEDDFKDSPTKHLKDDLEAGPLISRLPFDSSSPTLGGPQTDDTSEELVGPSILSNLNPNVNESSGVYSVQDPIQFNQLSKLQDRCVDHSIGPKVSNEQIFTPLKTF